MALGGIWDAGFTMIGSCRPCASSGGGLLVDAARDVHRQCPPGKNAMKHNANCPPVASCTCPSCSRSPPPWEGPIGLPNSRLPCLRRYAGSLSWARLGRSSANLDSSSTVFRPSHASPTHRPPLFAHFNPRMRDGESSHSGPFGRRNRNPTLYRPVACVQFPLMPVVASDVNIKTLTLQTNKLPPRSSSRALQAKPLGIWIPGWAVAKS